MVKPRVESSTPPNGEPLEKQPKWRRDFPIDTAQDEYVARRDFVKFLTLTSAAFVIGQISIGAQNLIRRAKGKPPITSVAKVADIPLGGAISFNYPDHHEPCVLVRTVENQFLAYGQKCTHLSCAVLPDVEKGVFLCPCHHGIFDVSSGRPLAGPPRRPLPKITLRIESGTIYATGVELRT
ncbi:MAG: Rieske 2Fe-2S domain-containing protein [Candidatus Omnitrophica bacterium]|nr:Rieske 2Fe-2S domain-containing protein [Candidatus Omnitrophota bacterium]